MKKPGRAKNTASPQMVGMGQIVVLSRPETAYAVLGSCIGLTLYHQRLHVGAMVHIVLPRSSERSGVPGKFADTAIPHMLERLSEHHVFPAGLVAKITGGASMFAATGAMQIGDSNHEEVRRLLADLRIPIAGEHVGGSKGRKVTFETETGRLTIDQVGEPSEVL